MSTIHIITFFTFLAVACLIVMAVLLVTAVQTSPQARIRRRLTAIGRNPYASRAEIQSLLKSPVYSDIPWFNEILGSLNFVRSLTMHLERANLDMSVGLFILFSGFFGGITIALMTLAGRPMGLALFVGAIGFAAPYLYVKYLVRKRLRRFLEQMPDGLDMISQGLQAGLGLNQAMVFVAKQVPDPLGTEFSVFLEEVNLGLPMADGLKGFEERVPLAEVRLLAIALLVQREVGGSLAELLNKLADVIRDRFRIERQIKTLTAQNRMSAWVVASLPPALALFMFSMDPALMNETWRSPMGRGMYVAALGLEIVGILAFRRLIRIHI